MSIADLSDRDLEPVELDRMPVVGFHLAGSLPPLLAVRTWSEEVENYRRLAEQLGPGQPIYTVSPPRGELASDFPTDTDAWADFCIRRFDSLLERQQVVLMGWSYAGVVALRIAERVAARGVDVRLVVLVDSTLPRKKPWGSSLKRGELHHFAVMAARWFEFDDASARGEFFRRYLRKALKRWGKKLVRPFVARGEPKQADAETASSIENRGSRERRLPLLMRAIRIAYLKHQARPTRLPVALFWTEESRQRAGDTSLGWSSVLQGDIEIVRVGGTHHTVFAKEHIGALATRLAGSLRRVWAEEPAPRD